MARLAAAVITVSMAVVSCAKSDGKENPNIPSDDHGRGDSSALGDTSHAGDSFHPGDTGHGGDAVTTGDPYQPGDPNVSCPQDCTGLLYTACSCSSADPCGWVGDSTCDAQCATLFPSNHFEDPVDCAAHAYRSFSITARFYCYPKGDATYAIAFGDSVDRTDETTSGLMAWSVYSNKPPVWAMATVEGADPGAFVRACSAQAGTQGVTKRVTKVFKITDTNTSAVVADESCDTTSSPTCTFGEPSLQYDW